MKLLHNNIQFFQFAVIFYLSACNNIKAAEISYVLDYGNNPFLEEFSISSGNATPTFGDLNNDGHEDLIIGANNGRLSCLINNGPNAKVTFTEKFVTTIPFVFSSFDVGNLSTIALGDIDGDTDLDMLVGSANTSLTYYLNSTSNVNDILFLKRVSGSSPFFGIEIGENSAPVFVDIDNDNDLDVFVGEAGGVVRFLRNTRNFAVPNYTTISGSENPLNFVNLAGDNPKLTFVDIDNDNDFDLFIGESDNANSGLAKIHFYLNTGTAENAQFIVKPPAENPLEISKNDIDPKIAFTDFDKDNDFDAFIGFGSGALAYFENIGNNTSAQFQENSSENSPTKLHRIKKVASSFAVPSFVDIDNDGDLDAFIGERNNLNHKALRYYENFGDKDKPDFQENSTFDSFINTISGNDIKPAFVDIDSDGDFDLFLGERSGGIFYYKNVGDKNSANFLRQTGTDNLFNGVDVGTKSAPTFVDIDADGDFDLFIGVGGDASPPTGEMKFYRNVGSNTQPQFMEELGEQNPLNVDIGAEATPTFVDIDLDGDFDVFIGTRSPNNMAFFKNNGTAQAASFEQLFGTDHPYPELQIGRDTAVTFVDIDNDGSQEAFMGEVNGGILFFDSILKSNPEAITDILDAIENIPEIINVLANDKPDIGSIISVEISSQPSKGSVSVNQDMTVTYTPEIFFLGRVSFTYLIKDDQGGESSAKVTLNYKKKNGILIYSLDTINNPLNGINVGILSAPKFIDIDNDGDFDLFIGFRNTSGGSALKFFKNTGFASNPVFVLDNSFASNLELVGGNDFKLEFVDIDNDDDFDIFIGERFGAIHFLRNTGDKNNPLFSAGSSTENPLNTIDVGFRATPVFVDIDNDSDFDLFVGIGGDSEASGTGKILFFKNNGDSQSPNFVEFTGTDNPLDVDIGSEATPAFVDIDRDGDFDVFIGSRANLPLTFYENIGNAETANFQLVSGSNNLYSSLQAGGDSVPTFVDIDNDGLLESFIGVQSGEIHFFEVAEQFRPSAVEDSTTTGINFSTNIDVLKNDLIDNTSLRVTEIIQNPANGTVSVNSDNTILYTPNESYVGEDLFEYRADDDESGIVKATVSINIVEISKKDFEQTLEGKTATFDVLKNDLDNFGLKSIISVTDANNGNVTISNNKIVYTPETGYIGSDGFSYVMETDQGVRAGADVDISVLLRKYEDWVKVNFSRFNAAADKLPSSDPDGDGRANLLEFAVGSSPETIDQKNAGLIFGLENFVDFEGNLVLSFNRLKGNDTIMYIPEFSGDLQSWSSNREMFVEIEAIQISQSIEQVKIKLVDLSSSSNNSSGNKFIRLRIEEK